MENASPCPGLDDLRQFLLGEVADFEIEAVERHLEQCPRCLQVVQQLEAEDSLVKALHLQARVPPGSPDNQVESMIRRLEGMALVRSNADPSTNTPSSACANDAHPREADTEPSSLDAPRETYAFLRPPQGPGELGWLGAYRILNVLGTGGMGIVFRAEDTRLGRQVALKVLRPFLADSARARQRFFREARAAAAVEHEHVVHVNEVGEDHGISYVSMPLLQGESLESRLLREARLPIAEVLRIGRETAEGLRAAHERGLIHRDIKPANLWLEGAHGRVKVLDFGLARPALDADQVTRSGFLVGTPAFMAPEQAQGGEIDGRADLFSLGCVLYRSITGHLPFPGATAVQVLHALTSTEPAPPRALNPAVPQDLDELLRRLLSKDPAGRPSSAQQVVEALAAIERGQPIDWTTPTALPPSPSPQGTRTLRRPLIRKLGLAGLIAVLVTVACLYGPTLIRFVTNRGELTVETDRDVLLVFSQDGRRVRILHTETTRSFSLPAGEYDVQVLEAPSGAVVSSQRFSLARGGRAVIAVPAALCAAGSASSEKLPLPLTLRGAGAPVYAVAFSPDGRLLAAAGAWKARVWELATGKAAVTLEDEKASFMSIAFRPDGKQLVGGGRYSLARVWDLPSGKLLLEKGLRGEVRGLAYSPDGKRLASASILFLAGGPTNVWGSVVAWDPDTGAEKVVFAAEAEQVPVSVAYRRDGRQVAAGMVRWNQARGDVNAGDVRLWDPESGKRIRTLASPTSGLGTVAYSPDGKRLARSTKDGTIRLWETTKGQALTPLKGGHTGPVVALAFCPDGRRLASGGVDCTVRIWDLDSGKPVLVLKGHTGTIQTVAFSPDGHLVASAGDDGLVRVWDAARTQP